MFLRQVVGHTITGWNDALERTEAEVLDAFTRAAELAREEGEMTDDELIEENHAIFSLTGPPREGYTLQQEIRAQLEEAQAELDDLRERLKRAEQERDEWKVMHKQEQKEANEIQAETEAAQEEAKRLREALKWSKALYSGWVGLLQDLPPDENGLRPGEWGKLLADLRGAVKVAEDALPSPSELEETKP